LTATHPALKASLRGIAEERAAYSSNKSLKALKKGAMESRDARNPLAQ
jgi:hypothetical protein